MELLLVLAVCVVIIALCMLSSLVNKTSRVAVVARIGYALHKWRENRKPQPQMTGIFKIQPFTTPPVKVGNHYDRHPKCPVHDRSTFIQLDAQSHIMACAAARVHQKYGPSYLTPDYSVCGWVSYEFRETGAFVTARPFIKSDPEPSHAGTGEARCIFS